MSHVTDTFIELCSIASPSGREDRVSEYLLKHLAPYVAENLHVDAAGNIYISESGYGEPLLLCAHIDTVEPARDQTPVVKDGVIYSDGQGVLGADDKCAVAAILEAYIRLKTSGRANRAFEILFTVREETDGGLREFPREKIASKSALVADISLPVGTIVTAAPYVTGYAVTVTAPGGHVGRITRETIHPLNFFQAFARAFPPRKTRDTITNIAMIKMGESYNSVPQSLYFTGEIRTFSQKDHELFAPSIMKKVQELDAQFGTKSSLEVFPYCVGYRLKHSDIMRTKKILQRAGHPVVSQGVYSVGDFNILAEWGITPINIGNGARDVHTTHEHISIESLVALEQIIHDHLV